MAEARESIEFDIRNPTASRNTNQFITIGTNLVPLIYLAVVSIVIAVIVVRNELALDFSEPITCGYWMISIVTFILYFVSAYKSPGYLSEGPCAVNFRNKIHEQTECQTNPNKPIKNADNNAKGFELQATNNKSFIPIALINSRVLTCFKYAIGCTKEAFTLQSKANA